MSPPRRKAYYIVDVKIGYVKVTSSDEQSKEIGRNVVVVVVEFPRETSTVALMLVRAFSRAGVCARIYVRNHVPRDLGMDIYPCVYLDGDVGVSLD